MTNEMRKISDEELVEIAGGFEQPIIGIDDKSDGTDLLDRKAMGGGGTSGRPGGGSTIPVEPVGGTSGGNSGLA